MREYLYRAKDLESGQWVYGNLIETQDGEFTEYAILEKTAEHRYGGEYGDDGWYKVDKDTIGEYAGLSDENGNNVFEGDIIRDYEEMLGLVQFGEASWEAPYIYPYMGFHYKDKDGNTTDTALYQKKEIYVIGNIYDNPELINK